MRRLLPAALMLLPARLRPLFARVVLGWDVHRTAYIGRSWIQADKVSLAAGSSIGPRNRIRGLAELRLEEGASIATRNQVEGIPLGSPIFRSDRRYPALILGPYAMVTDAHEIDCSDRVELKEYARLAGFRSQVLTHSLNLVRDRYESSPVVLGERATVMSGCILLNGMQIPARAIVSAGSVVTTKLAKEQTFYRGNTAVEVRPLPDNLAYFRHEGPNSTSWTDQPD